MLNSSKAKQLFCELADLPRHDRAARIDSECGSDAALRFEVESLLAAHDEDTVFLRTTRSGLIDHIAPRGAAGPTATEGDTIGPYRLGGRLGEGGFGVVYQAEQTWPIKRLVALKIIKAGLDTKQVISRFEAERQTLALMDHPNIARVLDAGATDAGRPYFVMELVEGVPITAHCETAHLPLRARLELLREVCLAVQHAHQRGIIHRDLKPSNVLVAIRDGRPTVKVIDFGVAKAISGELSQQSLATELGQMVGTPAYMSPEQAGGSELDIDTRADVYSLGVLLYELVTGATPFDKQRLRTAGFAEIIRILREEEPLRPSARTNTRIPADLDWIALKCLDKDRTRRYETVHSLLADIDRYLHDEPVAAGPPSPAYRLTKFLRRHRLGVTAGVAVVVALLVSMASLFALWRGAVQTSAAERELRRDAEAQRRAALDAQAEAERQRATAERESADLAATLQFLRSTFALVHPWDARLEPTLAAPEPLETPRSPLELTLAEVLQHAGRQLVPQLGDRPRVEAAVRDLLGTIMADLGLDVDAEVHLSIAAELRRRELGPNHPDTLRSMAKLGRDWRWQGSARDYLRASAEGLALTLGPDHPDTRLVRQWRAMRELRLNADKAEPERELRAVLEAERRANGDDHPRTWQAAVALAQCLVTAGPEHVEEAAALLKQTESASRRLNDQYPLLRANLDITLAYYEGVRSGENDVAMAHLESGIREARRAFGGQSIRFVHFLQDVAYVAISFGQAQIAEHVVREAIENWRMGVSQTDHMQLELWMMLERVLAAQNKPRVDVDTGRARLIEELRARGGEEAVHAVRAEANRIESTDPASSELLYREALRMSREVWREDRLETTWAMHGLAWVLRQQQRYAEAVQLYREALAIRERLFGPFGFDTIWTMSDLSSTLEQAGELDAATKIAARMVERLSATRDSQPELLFDARNKYGWLLYQTGALDAARVQFETLIREFGELHSGMPHQRGIAERNLGLIAALEGRYAAAEQHLLQSVGTLDGLRWPPGEVETSIRQLVDLYQRWHVAAPGSGHDAKAMEWRSRLGVPASP